MLASHLVRATILDRPLDARLLLPLLEETLALRRRALLRGDDATILVVLQVLLRQTTAGVVRSAVHHLRAGADRLLVSAASRKSVLRVHLFEGCDIFTRADVLQHPHHSESVRMVLPDTRHC